MSKSAVPDRTPCDEWGGTVDSKGYGRTSDNHLAHRVAYMDRHGQLSPEVVLHHTCGNPLCVNTGHLRPMTRGEHARVHWPAASHLMTCSVCGEKFEAQSDQLGEATQERGGL